jgi:ubiquitin C-terminal hydrolase
MTSSSKKRRRRERQQLERARGISLVDNASPVPPIDSSVNQKRARLSCQNTEGNSLYLDATGPSTVNIPVPSEQIQLKETSWKRVDFVLPRASGKNNQFIFDRQANPKQDVSSSASASLPDNGNNNNQKAKECKKSETIEDILFAGKRQKERDRENLDNSSSDQKKDITKVSRVSDKKDEVISVSESRRKMLEGAFEARKRKLEGAFEAAHQETINPTIGNFVDLGKNSKKNHDQEEGPRAAETPKIHEESTRLEKNGKSKVSRDNAVISKATDDHPKKQESGRNIIQHTSSGQISGMTVKEAVRDKHGMRPRANSTDGELNLPQRGLCDERMVLEAHKWNPEKSYVNQIPPRGLHNLGNTCFMNATLQCLAYVPPLCQTLIAISTNKPKNGQNGGKQKIYQGQKITSSLCYLYQQAHGSNGFSKQGGGAIAPKKIANALPTIGTCGSRNGYKFRLGRQEDAHEFLVHLLDAMNDGELRAAGINQHVSGWRDRLPVTRLNETTFIHRIFGGYFRSQVRCRKCNYRSNTYDPFLDLSLEVSKKSSTSVLNALSEFTRKETLDAANQWKCSGCKKYVCATKQLTVFRPPLSLCIQLKRFAFNSGMNGYKSSKYGGGGGSKISKPIEFPATLNLPLSDNRSCRYTLTGIVIHVGGSSHSGHYTAYVKKPDRKGTSQWYHIDDSDVEPVSEKTVLRQKDAYLLFYCRTEVKLEFPAPPMRGMSASEATEKGKARARVRADSFSTDDPKEEPKRKEQEMTKKESSIKQHAQNPQENGGTKEPKNGVERVKTKIHPLASPKTLRQNSEHRTDSPSVSYSNGASKASPYNESSSDSSVSSSDDESSDDKKNEKRKETVKANGYSNGASKASSDNKSSSDSSVSSSDDESSDDKKKKKKKESQSDVKANGDELSESNDSSYEDESGSSDSDSSSSSTSSSKEKVQDDNADAVIKANSITRKSDSSATRQENNGNESDSDSSSSSSSKDEVQDDNADAVKVNPIIGKSPSSATRQENNDDESDSSSSSSSSSSSEDEADSENEDTPPNEDKVQQQVRQTATNKIHNKTTVVLNNADSRGKVKVMLGPRKRKFWESKASALPSNSSNFQLLGNLKVSRWDDDGDNDDCDNKNDKSEVNRDREKIIEKIVKQDRSRKRKMHLDRWDSHLDQGKMKKVKEARDPQIYFPTTSTEPKKNIFQRIQTGVQKMSRGKPKGQFRPKANTTNKKRKY